MYRTIFHRVFYSVGNAISEHLSRKHATDDALEKRIERVERFGVTQKRENMSNQKTYI